MKIPTYIQEKLASAIVGTPGVDGSAAAVAGSALEAGRALAGAASQVQGRQQQGDQMLQRLAMQSFGEVSAELSIRRKQQAAVEAQAAEESRQVQIAAHKMRFAGELEDQVAQQQLDYRANPFDAPKAIDKNAEAWINDYVKRGGVGADVADAFRKDAYHMVTSQRQSTSTWAIQQRKENDKAAINISADEFSTRVQKLAGDRSQFMSQLKFFDGLREGFEYAQGAKGVALHEEKRQQAFKDFVWSALNGNDQLVSNPDLAEALLRDKEIGGKLGGPDIDKIRDGIDKERKRAVDLKDKRDELNTSAIRNQMLSIATKANTGGTPERPNIGGLIDAQKRIKLVLDAELAKPEADRSNRVLTSGNALYDKMQTEIRGWNADQLKVKRDAEREAKEGAREARATVRDAEHKRRMQDIAARESFFDGPGGAALTEFQALKRVSGGKKAGLGTINDGIDLLMEAQQHAPNDHKIARKIDLELTVLEQQRARWQDSLNSKGSLDKKAALEQRDVESSKNGQWFHTDVKPLTAAERFTVAVSGGAPPMVHGMFQAVTPKQKFAVDLEWTEAVSDVSRAWRDDNSGKDPSQADYIKILADARNKMHAALGKEQFTWMKKTK